MHQSQQFLSLVAILGVFIIVLMSLAVMRFSKRLDYFSRK